MRYQKAVRNPSAISALPAAVKNVSGVVIDNKVKPRIANYPVFDFFKLFIVKAEVL